MTTQEAAELRSWAEAHAPHGSVQARQVLAMLASVDRLDGVWAEVRHLRAVDAASRAELDRYAARIEELESLVRSLAERCAEQSGLLSKNAELKAS